jgi:hypothetical protein
VSIGKRIPSSWQLFGTAAWRLGLPVKYETFGGNTVAKTLFFAGITSVVHYSSDDKLAQAPNEFVIVDELGAGVSSVRRDAGSRTLWLRNLLGRSRALFSGY